jgi:HlyD family secretion protein
MREASAPTNRFAPMTSPSSMARTRSGRIVLWSLLVLAAVLAIAIGAGVLPWRSPSSSAAQQHVNELTQIGAWGRLAPRGEVRALAAPSAADGVRIVKLNVTEGQRVREGEVIAVLDSHERREAAVGHARSLLALAEARLEQVRHPSKPSEVEAQEALIARHVYELTQAEADFKREDALSQRQAGVQSMLEQARLKWNQAVQNKRQAEAQLESLKVPRPNDVLVAERQVDEARSSLKQAEADLALTEIRSPSDATVLRVHHRAGERIGDKGVVEIGDIEQMYAIAEVYEADLARVTMGQPARVRVPTLKLELSGTVEQLGYVVQRKDVFNIDPVADTDARVVEVWIKLPLDVPQAVRQLSNARVEVIIDVSDKTLDRRQSRCDSLSSKALAGGVFESKESAASAVPLTGNPRSRDEESL